VGNDLSNTDENYMSENPNLQKTATFFFPKNDENNINS